jgi:hypothetical protein
MIRHEKIAACALAPSNLRAKISLLCSQKDAHIEDTNKALNNQSQKGMQDVSIPSC